MLTQIFKGFFDKFPIRFPTRFLAYIIALLILLTATFFTGGRELSDYILCAINAAIVSMSANGSFDAVKSVQKDTVSIDVFDSGDEDI